MLRNKLGYLFLLLISCYLLIMYEEWVLSLLFSILLLLPVIMYAFLTYQRKRIRTTISCKSQIVYKDEIINIEIKVENTSIFPLAKMKVFMEYQNEFEKKRNDEILLVTLDGKSEQNITLEYQGVYCGNVKFKLTKVKIYDYLQLFVKRTKLEETVTIAVLPKLCTVREPVVYENPYVIKEGEEYSKNKSGDDVSEIFRVREFIEGDKLNRIHWNLTLKEDRYMVKEFSDPIDCSNVLLLELPKSQKPVIEEIDALLSMLYSLSVSLTESALRHKIYWYNNSDKVLQSTRINKLEELYELLGIMFRDLGVSSEQSVLQMFDGESRYHTVSNLLYLTTELTTETALFLGEIKGQAIARVIMAGESEAEPEVKEELVQLGISYQNGQEVLS